MSEPRALLDDYQSSDAIPWESGEETVGQQAPKAFAALRAVLDKHQPVHDERTGWLPDHTYGTVSPACTTCGSQDLAVAWPCPTVQAITTALEAK